MFVDVAVPLPLDQLFTYEVPPEMQGEVQPGMRVLVPFGPRRLTGVVVGFGEAKQDRKLKTILDVLDETPSFTPEMLRLTRWMAEYYVCGWGEVLRAALPAGTDVESRIYVHRTEEPAGEEWKKHRTASRVLAYLDAHTDVTLSGIRKVVPRSSLSLVRRLEHAGLVRIEELLTGAKVQARIERAVRLVGDPDPASVSGARRQDVLRALLVLREEGIEEPSLAVVLARSGASSAAVAALAGKGLVEITRREVMRSSLEAIEAVPPAPDYPFSPVQEKAFDRIQASIAARKFETFLLYGVTGSGKTEVYIAALKEVLARGQTGIVLVPEISLTPQTVRRFRSHFGDEIAVLHSRMSLGERYDAWRQLRAGRYSVVIGPRSAILAPLENVGLIVVDEEQEASYKQFDPAPRYHARDVAVMRAYQSGAVCILGSATPSIESFVNAQAGKYHLLHMPDRVPVPGLDAAPLPDVHVVDLRLENRKVIGNSNFSRDLREAIQQRLERKEQIILLQNRRGYAPTLVCRNCGWSPLCTDCSVTLTYHKASAHLRCHYCGRTERPPRHCPKCGEQQIELLGVGTQRVEEELASLFPEARVLRMDLDSTSRKNAHHRLLDQFGKGQADILVGTQMVAKGLDFGRVTLVGVINADAGLMLPDFRSDERGFQLLTQVAGRAGRADLRGEVILQTRNPAHPAIRFAREHDYDGFVEAILPERQAAGWPPFSRLVGIEFKGPEEQVLDFLAQRWTDFLRENAPSLRVLGPSPAFIERIKMQHRRHTVIKVPRSYSAGDLQSLLRLTRDQMGAPPEGYSVAIDIDAVSLL